MDYKNIFDWADSSGIVNIKTNTYIQKPERISTISSLLYHDRIAQRTIQEAQNLIEVLTEYRKALYKRYSAFNNPEYTMSLSLKREILYYTPKKISYTVKVEKIYNDKSIKPELIEGYTFAGAERNKAKLMFNELQLKYVGIETVVDIDKKQWEK